MNLDPFYNYWREWFAQPEAEKLKHLRQPGRGGYYPLGSEAPGYTGKPDPKEYFHWRAAQTDPNALCGPDNADDDTYDLFFECYNRAVVWLNQRGLNDVVRAVRWEDCVLRILHYLPTPDGLAGQAHRDFDLLTVSVPGTCPGLEIEAPGTFECPVCRRDYPHTADRHECSCDGNGDPCFYARETCPLHGATGRARERKTATGWVSQERGIQVGEMLEIYSHNFRSDWDPSRRRHLSATTHRVRTPPNTERFKAVFFYLPPKDFELRPGYTADDYLKDALTRAGTINVGVKA